MRLRLHPVLPPLLVVSVAMLLYVITLPRSITLEDAGLFQMVCHLGGLSHPPGYPLFTSLCQPMVAVFGAAGIDPIISGNLVSAVFASLAVTAFYFCCRELGMDVSISVLAGLTLAASPAFWSQAIIIEVYSLAALTIFACAFLLLRFTRTESRGCWYAACFTFGLALSNHWPLVVLSMPALLMFAAKQPLLDCIRSPGCWLISITCFALGLIPYLALFEPEPAIAVTGGISSFQEFLDYVSRRAYSVELAPTSQDRLNFLFWLPGYSLIQAGIIGIPVVLAGIVFSFRRFGPRIALGWMLLWAGTTVILAMILGFPFNETTRSYFAPYTVIAMSAPAVWFATGLERILDWLRARLADSGRFYTRTIIAVLAIGIPLQHLTAMDRSHSQPAESFARVILETLPPDSVLFVIGDDETGPLGYLHHVEHLREDIELRSWNNTVFPNRLGSPFLAATDRERLIANFIASTDRPVFVTQPLLFPSINYGAYIAASGTEGTRLEKPLLDWLDYALNLKAQGLVTQPHEERFLIDRLYLFARLIAEASDKTSPELLPPQVLDLQQRLLQTFPGQLARIEGLMDKPAPDVKTLIAAIEQVEEQTGIPPATDRQLAARFQQLAADARHLQAQ